MLLHFFSLFCVVLVSEVQANLTIYLEDADLVEIDDEYFDSENTILMVNYEEERNTLSTNLSIITKWPDDLLGHLQVFGYSQGEYKIPVGLDVEMPLCDMYDEPTLMGPYLHSFNFPDDKCPPDVGIYFSDRYFPNMDLLPDTYPTNRYRIILQILRKDNVIFEVHAHVDIRS